MRKIFGILAFTVLCVFGYSVEIGVQGMPSVNIYADTVSMNFDVGLGLKLSDLPFSIFNMPNDTIKINTEFFVNFFSTEDRRYYGLGIRVLPLYSAKVFEVNKVNVFLVRLGLGIGVGYQGLSQSVMGMDFNRGNLLLDFEGRLEGLYSFVERFYVGLSLGYDVMMDPSGEISLAYSPKVGIPIIYEF